mmetsp:Transcript_26744/g.40808  ORF Transcript_26744/g.40808 Transcript_26744/m.40808 type:complete len:80 (+) Transcript_26744:750-989(+)
MVNKLNNNIQLKVAKQDSAPSKPARQSTIQEQPLLKKFTTRIINMFQKKQRKSKTMHHKSIPDYSIDDEDDIILEKSKN